MTGGANYRSPLDVWAELKLLLDEIKLESFIKDNRILVDWDPSGREYSVEREAGALAPRPSQTGSSARNYFLYA